MIEHCYIRYWRWNPKTGVRYRLYPSTSDWDFDLAEWGLISAAQARIGVEGDGDKIRASDVALEVSNARVQYSGEILDLGAGEWVFGRLELVQDGILYPLIDPDLNSGSWMVVAECLLIGRHEPADSELSDTYGALRLGAISTYGEYLEGGNVVILPGYLELRTVEVDEYGYKVRANIIALDKLLAKVPASILGLRPLRTPSELLDTIRERFPFIEDYEVELPSLGMFQYICRRAEITNLQADYAADNADTSFDELVRATTDRQPRLYAWRYNDSGVQHLYAKIRSLNGYEWVHITLMGEDVVAASITMENTRPSWLEHTRPSWIPMDQFDEDNAEWLHRHIPVAQAPLWTLAPGDLAWTKHPYSLVGVARHYWGLGLAWGNPTNIKNCPSWATANHTALAYYSNGSGESRLLWLYWDGSNWSQYTVGSTVMGSYWGAYTTTDETYIIWYPGYKRLWIVSSDKRRIWSLPSPEFGSGFDGWLDDPHNWYGDRGLYTYDASSGYYDEVTYPHGGIKGAVKFLAPNLIGDTPLAIGDNRYVKYPIYFIGDDGKSYLWVGCSSSDEYWDIDCASAEHAPDASPDLLWQRYRIIRIHDIPADIPMFPVFCYDDAGRLRIWYYSGEAKELRCYDYKMMLLEAYYLGVDSERVALGLDYAGRLLVLIAPEDNDSLILARHEPTEEIYLPAPSEDVQTAADLVSMLARWGFCVWWIDRESGRVKLFIKPRYSGEERGGVPIIERSVTVEEAAALRDQTRPPSRDLVRRYWDKYADQIYITSQTHGDIVRVGAEESLYTYHYEMPAGIYHRYLAQRIGRLLWRILSHRRHWCKFPLPAWRGGYYDILEIFGRRWSVLMSTSDYAKRLVTDIEAIDISDVRIDAIDILDCLLGGVYYNKNTSAWAANPELTEGCYCDRCEYLLRNDAGTGIYDVILDWLNTWYPDGLSGVSGDVVLGNDDGARAVVIDLVMSDDDLWATLEPLLIGYIQCLTEECGYGG